MSPFDALRSADLEVLWLLAQGRGDVLIAQEPAIARTTIKTHLERTNRKGRVSDRTQAAVCLGGWNSARRRPVFALRIHPGAYTRLPKDTPVG